VYDGFIREGQGLIGCRFVNGPVLLLRSKAQTGLVASEDRGRHIAISALSRSMCPLCGPASRGFWQYPWSAPMYSLVLNFWGQNGILAFPAGEPRSEHSGRDRHRSDHSGLVWAAAGDAGSSTAATVIGNDQTLCGNVKPTHYTVTPMKYCRESCARWAKLEAGSSGGSGMVFVSAAESASGAVFSCRKSG